MSSSYQVPRCQHIRTNGTQCNSPAMRKERRCYYHLHHRPEFLWLNLQQKQKEVGCIQLPVLEDASSIQSAISQVISLLLQNQIDSKKAGLILYALQTASSNLARLQAESKEDMHWDPEITAQTPLRGWTLEPWEREVLEKAATAEAAAKAAASEPAKELQQTPEEKIEPQPEQQVIAELHAVADQASAVEQSKSASKKKPDGMERASPCNTRNQDRNPKRRSTPPERILNPTELFPLHAKKPSAGGAEGFLWRRREALFPVGLG